MRQHQATAAAASSEGSDAEITENGIAVLGTPPTDTPSAPGRFAAAPTPVPEGCQRVSKTGRDEGGRALRIGGTLCFEPNGQGFIVEGSRFIIDTL